MNLPNKLTIFRIILIPVILVFIISDFINLDMQFKRYIATTLFIFACITDCIDGYIARKYNLITNFGKFMDPLADKILVISLMIAIITMKDSVVNLSPWVVIIIIAREFLVTGFRIIAIEKNLVISAGNSGKIKTVLQMFMVIFLLLNFNNNIFINITNILIISSVILTVYSLAEYIIKNSCILKDE